MAKKPVQIVHPKLTLIGVVKIVGATMTTLGVIYTTCWAMGIAPISNGQAEKMIQQAVQKTSIEIRSDLQERYTEKFVTAENNVSDVKKKVDDLKDQTSRVDERTKNISEELKQQRDLQNQILLQLQQLKRR